MININGMILGSIFATLIPIIFEYYRLSDCSLEKVLKKIKYRYKWFFLKIYD